MKNILKFNLYLFVALFCLVLFFPSAANAQRRDYLTDAEIELVRDNQQLDLRVEVLMKAINRRFALINNAAQVEGKDADKWGELPKGTRLELVSDIAKILQKAIDDIDNVAAKEQTENKFFYKAVKNLAEAAQKFQPQLKTLYDKAANDKEKGAILTSIDLCSQIIEAAAKLPKEMPKDEKKKKS